MIAASLPDSEAVVKLLLQRDAFIDEKSTLFAKDTIQM
jgi:hypothetical protein